MIRFVSMAVALCAAAVLAACSRNAGVPAKPAAKVNGTEISLVRYRLVLANQPSASATPADVMDRMIDRELFAQKGRTLKLEHELGVQIALAEARDDILAQAYLQNIAGSNPVDPGAVSAFYFEHPELFERRRIFRILELGASVPQTQMPALAEFAEHARSISDVAAWLKKNGFGFDAGGATKTSEHITQQLLVRLETMHDGDIAVMQVAGGASIVQLLESDPAPLSKEQATPMIEQLLAARRRADVAERERKHLRSTAAIELMIDLGRGASPQRAEVSPPAPSALDFVL